jgi:hypothetical protein
MDASLSFQSRPTYLSNPDWNDYSIIKCTGEAVIAAHPVIVILYLA